MTEFPYLDSVTADPRLLGMPHILCPMAQFNSSPRMGMFAQHLTQSMVINHPEFNKIFTGFEHHFIPYTIKPPERDYDCEIVEKILKYTPSLVNAENCPQLYVITLTKEAKPRLDYFTLDRYFKGTQDFGWIPEIQNRHRLVPGDILDKETPIMHSPSAKGDYYCFGANLNVIYGSFPETIEDAFIISESAAKKLGTWQISEVMIDCRMDQRPLNLYGSQHDEKFLPDIGSYVRDDGLLCAFRPIHWSTIVADSDPKMLQEFLPLQDYGYYIEPGAKIVDLTFNINRNKINNCYNQARRYEQDSNVFWQAIYKTYIKYKGKYKLTERMESLVKTAIYRLIAQSANIPSLDAEFRKAARNADIEGDGSNGSLVDFMQVIVTYAVPRLVEVGSKLSDVQGAKGIVGKIYPDDCMPIDDYGIRADLWIDMGSPVARNNPGQFYETGVNRIAEFVRRKTESVYRVQGVDAAFATIVDWYQDINPNQAALVTQEFDSPKARQEFVEESIAEGIRTWVPPFLKSLSPSDTDFWHALRNIKTWAQKWDVKPSPITYKTMQEDGSFKSFRTESAFSIGSKYIIHLNKIPEITAPGPASVNHIGIPVKSSSSNKYFPVSDNPYRYGEDEIRIMREVSRFINLGSNSPQGAKLAIETLLLSEHPTKIKRIPISNGDLSRTNAVAQLFHSVTATLGIETKHTKIDYAELPDEITESIWETDFDVLKQDQEEDEDDQVVIEKKTNVRQAEMRKMMESIEDEPLLETEEGDDLDTEEEGD